ncbi:MAG: PEP/pyruvate-binding domain-containing protein, partial [Acidobacteria bacterium]|nr:PEP/pyruvate-binding domain-containing protein [Acidobacteriota bacterium]
LFVAAFAAFALGQAPGERTKADAPTKSRPKLTASKNDYLRSIPSRAAFDSLARVYQQGTPYALPHVMFVIDRLAKNKIYFINSQRYRFHKDFLLATYLVPRGADIFQPIYIDKGRRFIVGTIAWQEPVQKFTWELWEGDLATSELIKLANDTINSAFYTHVSFKPNSERQDTASADLGIERVSHDELNRNQVYLALNTGSAVGRIHIIDKLDDTVEIGDNEILILRELPQSLPPVRGIIVAKPSSPLSHVNILAHGWGIPNIYVKDADKLFRGLNTYWMKLDARSSDYTLERVTSSEDIPNPPDDQVPPVNLTTTKLAPLAAMRKRDSISYGSKAANLGEMLNKRVPGVTIPDGFGIPFHWYDKFMQDNGFDDVILKLTDNNDFVHNPRIRRQKLAEFRQTIIAGKFDEALKKEILERWHTQLDGKPVFVRSSSNSEDLPNFSGAGLYSSVANVIDDESLITAVKKVWASLWNFDAYEARVRNYISQTDVYMSALVQVGINMKKGGVMITKDPFNTRARNVVYISAVCGHNSKVVDNAGIPEQLLYSAAANSVTVKTLSQQQSALEFDEKGDLRPTRETCAGPDQRVLTNAEARALAKAALAIKKAFGGSVAQDIEWGIIDRKIFIVQSRPYIEKK